MYNYSTSVNITIFYLYESDETLSKLIKSETLL